MANQTTLRIRQALYALARMVQAGQTYPHGDCPDVAPDFNICGTCKKAPFCRARQEFIEQMEVLDKMDRGY